MLHRISCARVDGMCVFLAVTDIVFPVISRSYDAAGRTVGFPYPVQVFSRIVVPVHRPVNTHFPWFSVRVEAVEIDFAYVHEHVLYAQSVQVCRHYVATVALCNGIEVKSRRDSSFQVIKQYV